MATGKPYFNICIAYYYWTSEDWKCLRFNFEFCEVNNRIGENFCIDNEWIQAHSKWRSECSINDPIIIIIIRFKHINLYTSKWEDSFEDWGQ